MEIFELVCGFDDWCFTLLQTLFVQYVIKTHYEYKV